MGKAKAERRPMRERIGWAVVSPSGQWMCVSPYTRKEAIREFVDPGCRDSADERKAEWAKWQKDGIRAIKVRISAVD